MAHTIQDNEVEKAAEDETADVEPERQLLINFKRFYRL